MKQVSWKDKATNADVSQRVNETRRILNTTDTGNKNSVKHFVKHHGLLKNTLKDKIIGKSGRGRKD